MDPTVETLNIVFLFYSSMDPTVETLNIVFLLYSSMDPTVETLNIVFHSTVLWIPLKKP